MCSKRDIIVFFAGVEACNTLSHVIISYSGTLPIEIFSVTLTQQLAFAGIVLNGLITAGLLWWAHRLEIK